MNRGELREKILWRLNQDVTSPQFWEEDYINDLINEAYLNFVTKTKVLETSTSLSLIAYQNLYKLADDCFVINRMYYETTDKIIWPVSWSALAGHDPKWTTTTGSRPEYYVFIPPNRIFLYPQVTADASDAVTYYYSKMTTNFTADSESPDFPAVYHDAIIEYALALALPRVSAESYLKKAMSYYAKYHEKIASMKKISHGRSNRAIRVRARF